MRTSAQWPTPREWVVVIVLSTLACGAAAVARGQPRSFDLLNYHLYNGYALLEGRLEQDILPAGPATFFNPVVDAVHFLGYRHVRPVVFAGLLGAFQGLNIVLVWGIARLVFGGSGCWLALLATVLAASGQNALSLLGTSFGDNTVSIPALAALLVLLAAERPGPGRLGLAGALGGAAVGLKLTMVAPHLGLSVLAAWAAWRQRRPLPLIAFGVGSLAGWGVTNGWWALELWVRFGNPFLPFFNGLFQSPWGTLEPLSDLRWAPSVALDWIRPPVDAALGRVGRLQEVPFRDPRLLLVFLGLLAWLVARLRRSNGGSSWSPGSPGSQVTVYWLITFGAWLGALHYYRYATVLELLAPLAALALLAEAWPRRISVIAPALAVVVLLTTSVGFWDGRREWRPSWSNPRLGTLALQPGQLILLPDVRTSYAAAFLPEDAVFVGLAYSWWHGPAAQEAIVSRIRDHEGPISVLQHEHHPLRQHERQLESAGVGMVEEGCELVRLGPGGNRHRLCRLERLGLRRAPP